MHPALSIIVFTSLSGLGYGIAMALGFGFGALDGLAGRAGYVISLVFIAIGLLSSTFHLGHPERAWRALTQWRSSWLSREGVLAVIAFVPLGLAALGSVIYAERWIAPAFIGGLLALATVYATSMIYASLRTVRQWNSALTSVVFITLAAAGGLITVAMLSTFDGNAAYMTKLAALTALAAAFWAKWQWWLRGNDETGASTIASATGLGAFGPVRRLEQPHTEENYLMREMGFRVARSHAAKLRKGVVIFAFAIPALALIAALFISAPAFAGVILALGLLSHLAGVLVERWLFFAEARHTVMLYYGDQAA